jgi:glycosyltransferase involved in cell wall biosynthesis
MKIALYASSWPPGSSATGVVTYASYIVPALRELGHEVFILTPNVKTALIDSYTVDLNKVAINRNSVWQRIGSLLSRTHTQADPFADRILSAILSLKREKDIDLIEMEESFGWSATISEAGILPVVVRLHGPWFLTGTFDSPLDPAGRTKIFREGRGIISAAFVTSPSAYGLTAVRTYYDIPLTNAGVIPNAIDVASNKFRWTIETCDKHRILSVGRFDRLKGGDLVLHAFDRLAKRHPALRLTFVGPDNGIVDSSGKLSFEEFVCKNYPDLRTRIDYFPLLSSQDLMRLRREHLFTIAASRFEMFSYAIAEAMACGCPVVAPAVGGIPELVTDGRTGLLYESESVDALVCASERLLGNDGLLCDLGSQARRFCGGALGAAGLAKKTLSAYSAVVSSFAERKDRLDGLQ